MHQAGVGGIVVSATDYQPYFGARSEIECSSGRFISSESQLRPRELCGDLIVSGHTLTIFTSFYTFKYYAPKKLKPLSYMLNMLAVMAILAILFARKHYTIDVLLG
ncbi:hypothetical protein COOONC_08433 [Cooperia oncophora]